MLVTTITILYDLTIVIHFTVISKSDLFITEFLLEVDPDKRPDIFQASYVAFRITGRDCPVPNLHVSI